MARAKNLFIAVAGAATLMAGTQAIAAEPFNGPYIGVQGGWQQDRARLTLRTPAGVTNDRDTQSGFTYGGQIGYDANLDGQFVLGAEAFLTGDTSKNQFPGAVTFDGGRSFGLTARAGVLAGPRTLIYAKGGWENGRFTYEQQRFGLANLRHSANANGWTLGAGIEQMLTENVSARAEFRHTKFNSFSNNDLNAAVGGAAEARVNRNRLLVGLNYRF